MQYSELNRQTIQQKILECLTPYLTVEEIQECMIKVPVDQISIGDDIYATEYKSPKEFFENGLTSYTKWNDCRALTFLSKNKIQFRTRSSYVHKHHSYRSIKFCKG